MPVTKETMFDKLGDLLNETLEKGFVQYVDIQNDKTESHDDVKASKIEKSDFSKKTAFCDRNEKFSKNEDFSNRATIYKRKNYKKITPEIERAYRLLDIGFSATLDDVKKAYKEKLKYYHPDRYDDNDVLKKIATDKTRQVVEAFSVVTNFINS